MSKTQIMILLVLAVCIGYVSSQDVPNSPMDNDFSTKPKLYDATEGNMYRHIFSTAVYYAPNPAADNTASTMSINQTMTVGLFDST